MLNASTVKKWLVDSLGADAVPLHMVACSSALDKTAAFGIDDANVFGFWDWVGGRVSVSSSVGALPMALHFGYDAVDQFHTGACCACPKQRLLTSINCLIPVSDFTHTVVVCVVLCNTV